MADRGGGYSEHDDRVGGGGSVRGFPPRRRKGRGPFRGRMYSEMGYHQRPWSNAGPPRSRVEEEDGDVLMSDAHDVVRSRYTPYGPRPYRERGSLSNVNPSMRYNSGGHDQSVSKPLFSKTNWFRVTIPYGRKYEKTWLMDAIQSACSVPFTPVEVHHVNNRLVFYVEDLSVAHALKQLSREIVGPDGYKVLVLINPCSPPMSAKHDLKPEDLEQLKLCMSKRYDGSRQALDLKNILEDPDLVAQNIEVAMNRRGCVQAVLRIIEENIPELLSLDLSENKIFQLSEFADLPLKAPNLKSLNLSSNRLKSDRELDKFKSLKLEELWLDGNKLCDNFRDQSCYISAIRERFPKLLRLDGHELPPPIIFDLETPSTVPPSKGSYFCSKELKALILRFLQQYYAIYDSEDRQGLLDAYHEGACCSMSIPCANNALSKRSLGEYFKNSRNMKRLKDPSLRLKLLKHTKLSVVAFLSELPKTQHDINTFVIDVCAQTNTLLCFTVNGYFKEVESKTSEAMRAFSRVFIAVPAGNNGLCIVNDQLFIRNATHKDSQKAFLMPAPTPSSSPVPTLTAEQQEMLQNFSVQSGMNLEWSQKCLMDNDWDYTHAAHAFTQLRAEGKIPEVAFIN